MTPPGKMAENYPGWNAVAKVAFAIIGALSTIIGAWVARASDNQARALKDLEAAVYATKSQTSVLESRVGNVEAEVKSIQAHIYKEK